MLLEQLSPSPPLPPARASGHQCAPARALITLATCLTAGCTTFGTDLGHTPVVDKAALTTSILSDDLQLMQRLIKGSNSEKAETFAAVQRECDSAPTATHRLRLALALATPGHPASSPPEALHMLQDLMANPEGLVPGEQTLAQVEMKQIDDYLHLQQKAENLSADTSHTIERLMGQIRKLTADDEEKTKALSEANHKLEAIATIEKTTGEHGTRKPNSEGQPQ
jgi:hypothetical protein